MAGIIAFSISANTNGNPFRVILYKASTPNVPAYMQDVPFPHTTSQALVFSPIDEDTYIVRVYELISTGPDVLGQNLYSQVMSTKQKDVDEKPNLLITGGLEMAADQDTFDGSTTFPDNVGLIALQDYWVERRAQGTIENIEDVPPFGFKLLDGEAFNDGEVYVVHFYPKVKITNVVATTVAVPVTELTVDTTLDATYKNSVIDINSASITIVLTLPLLANFPDDATLVFLTNKGKQINAVIKAGTGETISHSMASHIGYGDVAQATPTDVVMGNGEYLKLIKKSTIWHVEVFTANLSALGTVSLGVLLNKNQLIADGAAGSSNELLRSEYVRLFRIVSQMSSGVSASKTAWLSNKTTFHLGNGTTTFGIPDLRGWFPRFMDLSANIDADRNAASKGSIPLDAQTDAYKNHDHATHGKGKIDGSGISGFLSRVAGSFSQRYSGGGGDLLGNTGTNIPDVTMRTSDNGGSANETRSKNVIFYPLINI